MSEEEALDISVSIPGHLVRSNTLQFMNFLRDISPEVQCLSCAVQWDVLLLHALVNAEVHVYTLGNCKKATVAIVGGAWNPIFNSPASGEQ